MDEAVTIRAAVPSDAPGMGEVAVAAWLAAYDGLMPAELLARQSVEERARQFREVLEKGAHGRGAHANWVAERDGQVIGYARTGRPRGEELPEGTAELYALYVHPDAWGTGVGARLQERALLHLRAAGYREVVLWVLTTNARARRFYERSGFVLDPTAEEVVQELFGYELPHTRYRLR